MRFNDISLKTLIFNIIKFGLILLVFYIIFKLGSYLIPFIVAFVIATLVEPIVIMLEKKAKIPRKLGAVISILFVLGSIITIATLIITKLVNELTVLIEQLGPSIEMIETTIASMINNAERFYNWLPIQVTNDLNIENIFNTLYETLTKVLKSLVGMVVNFGGSIPEVVIFIVVTLLATYFIVCDRKKIHSLLKDKLPTVWLESAENIIKDMFSGLFGWAKAQGILMTIAFIELNIGFFIMKVPHALVWAIIISVIDALPFFGMGAFLLPWSLLSFLNSDYRMGISLLMLYVICFVVRQLTEPKLLGEQIGVHPLMTLMAMYLGLRLFDSVLGIILAPILLVTAKGIISGLLKNQKIRSIVNNFKNSVDGNDQGLGNSS